MARKIVVADQTFNLVSTASNSDEKSYDVFRADGTKVGDFSWSWLRLGGWQWVASKNGVFRGAKSIREIVNYLVR